MGFMGLRHKGTEILFSWEWNAVVDGLDILYGYINQVKEEKISKEDLTNLDSDIIPAEDNKYDLGDPDKEWRNIRAHYGYFEDDVYARGSRVLVDGDPVRVYEFIEKAKEDIDQIYNLEVDISSKADSIKQELDLVKQYVEEIRANTERAETFNTYALAVGTSPIPLSDVDKTVRRIHVKVPSWESYLLYVGSADKQEFILEPKDETTLEVKNPKNVYVRSLGNITIYVGLEE